MATIIDVAKLAGVSFKTVSRVLNGETGVKPETKEKVLKAASELNYKVNTSARNLRSKRPHLVALLINNPSLNYSQDIQFGAMVGCQNAGFNLIVENPFEQSSLDRLIHQVGVLGVILTPPLADDLRLIERLEKENILFVRIGTELEINCSPRIGIDDRQASFEITQHLIDLGHKSIAFINGPTTLNICQRRKQGFFDAHEVFGLKVDRKHICVGDFSYVSGIANAESLLNSTRRPSAIYACNDEMAAGVLSTAYKLNIRVPEELSVVGFDDSAVAKIVWPALTTVHQSTREMAQKAIGILDTLNKSENYKHEPILLPHQIVVRGSTAKL